MNITRRGIIVLVFWLLIALADGVLRLYYHFDKQPAQVTWLAKFWYVFSIGLVVIALWEFWSCRKFSNLSITRQIAKTLPVNSFCDVTLTIRNEFSAVIKAEVIEHLPDYCHSKSLPAFITLQPNEFQTVNYQLKAIERGNLIIEFCELWISTELGFFQRKLIFNCESHSKIYPNYRSIMNYVLLATEQKTRQLGIRQRQLRGDGMEFHQLREYRTGDSLRQIDWRATSRLQKIISKDYQQERDQNIIFLLDCGRRMRTKDGELSHFDQALNATLLVSAIALRQGDAVGLSVFGGDNFFLQPKKGPSSINRTLNSVYSLHPSHRASDLIQAAENLNLKFKKRSLVIIVSNIREEDKSELKTAISALRKHHLVMLANLKEKVLDDVINQPINQFDDALKYSQTTRYLQQREKLHQTLTHSGVIAIDSTPEHLAINMVNQYFDIKRSGRL